MIVSAYDLGRSKRSVAVIHPMRLRGGRRRYRFLQEPKRGVHSTGEARCQGTGENAARSS